MLSQYQKTIIEYRKRVFSFAFYSLRNREDAEDITQDVFIKLWQHWQKIDHNRLGGWLMRVAHNAVIDHVRKHKNVADKVDQYADIESEAEPASQDQVEQLDRSKTQEYLEEAIQSLDDPFRSILVMRDIQGSSYAEIEQNLEMSSSQVKVYLHRARRKLRDMPKLRALFMQQIGAEEPQAAMPAVGINQRLDQSNGEPVNEGDEYEQQ